MGAVQVMHILERLREMQGVVSVEITRSEGVVDDLRVEFADPESEMTIWNNSKTRTSLVLFADARIEGISDDDLVEFAQHVAAGEFRLQRDASAVEVEIGGRLRTLE
jgi:hypothetical protein